MQFWIIILVAVARTSLEGFLYNTLLLLAPYTIFERTSCWKQLQRKVNSVITSVKDCISQISKISGFQLIHFRQFDLLFPYLSLDDAALSISPLISEYCVPPAAWFFASSFSSWLLRISLSSSTTITQILSAFFWLFAMSITTGPEALDQTFFHYSLVSIFLLGPPIFISTHFITAPYGKHHRTGWGPTLPPSVAWFLMESPTLWLTLLLYPFGQHRSHPKSILLISPFLIHYIHRTIIYPLRLPPRKLSKGYPISIALIAFTYNLLNSYLQTRWVTEYADYQNDKWFWWRFCVGLSVFFGGMAVNVKSDMDLMRLKKSSGGGGGYKIPRGGLFEIVSCPNYFGEIVEWFGWGVMTGSWVGLAFFVFTCANLVPRARANHEWYLQKFGEDYPKGRKAVIPFVY